MHDHEQKNGLGTPGRNAEPAVSQPRSTATSVTEASVRRAHLEYLVAEVASQLLAVPPPGNGALSEDMKAWALNRSRNVLAGLMGERL